MLAGLAIYHIDTSPQLLTQACTYSQLGWAEPQPTVVDLLNAKAQNVEAPTIAIMRCVSSFRHFAINPLQNEWNGMRRNA